MPKTNNYKPHPVDTRIHTTNQPNGFADWFMPFRSKRAYARIEKELSKFKHSSGEGDFAQLRIDVYEACFYANNWDDTQTKTITAGQARRKFLNNLPNTINAVNLVLNSLNEFTDEYNHIGANIFLSMKDKGYQIKKKNGYRMEQPLIDMFTSLKDTLKNVEQAEVPHSNILNLHSMSFPLPAPVGIDYLCFRYLGGRDLSKVKRPSKTTALAVYLSSKFRMFSDENSIMMNNAAISTVSKYGKPFLNKAAIIALCGVDGNPPNIDDLTEVNKTASNAKTFMKNNGDVLITRWR